MKRLSVVLLLGVALPTILLGVGWSVAAQRERDAGLRERQSQQERAIDAVRAAAEESLEELRSREDARPYYLYDYFYSPPDALALHDPVLVSPLAAAPTDKRIIGYFHVDPGGRPRSPHVDGAGRPTSRGRGVLATVNKPSLAAIRSLSSDAQPQVHTPLLLNDYNFENAANIESATNGSSWARDQIQRGGRNNPRIQRKTIAWSDLLGAGDASAEATTSGPSAAVSISYTPMAWQSIKGHLLMARVVSHRGVRVVQGVLLDRAALVAQWLPALLHRHAWAGGRVSLAQPGQPCALRRPVSSLLDGVELCAAPSASTANDNSIWNQIGMLAGLVVIVLLGLLVVQRGSHRAAELARRKSDFVNSMSHELRTPLTTIRMHAEMLADGLVSEERTKRVHEDLVRESARLTRLVDNVLELSRSDLAGRSLTLARADLAAVVRKTVDDQREPVALRGMQLRATMPAALELDFDESAVERIVINLIDNAVKYACADDGLIVDVELTREGEQAMLRVKDRGPGIASGDRERVFERFQRGARAASGAVPGTGIGLALVRGLARDHGGDARVATGDGPGAVIEVTFPLPQAAS